MASGTTVSTEAGDIRITAQGDATVTTISSSSGDIALSAADIQMLDGSLIATHAAGSVTVNATADWMMGKQSALSTQAGTITVNASGDLEVFLISSLTGDIALDAEQTITVVGDVLAPQLATGGALSVGTGAGIGGYLFDRLYVDVASISVDHRGGDVVISGKSGLKITGIHSQASDGWVAMLSGSMGLVETAGAISMDNGQVARISGRTIITKDVLTGRQMGGSDVYYVTNPALNASPSTAMLSDFNARLAQQWLAPGQGASAAQRLSSKAADLSTPLQRLSASDNAMAAFAPSVLGEMDAPTTTSALLDAAMTVMAQDQARAAAEGDTYTNWDQRSSAARTLSVSAPVESAPGDAKDAVAPTSAKASKPAAKASKAPNATEAPLAPELPAPAPALAPAPAQKDVKLSLPAAVLDFSQLGQADLSHLPQLAVPVAVESVPGAPAATDATSSAAQEDVPVV